VTIVRVPTAHLDPTTKVLAATATRPVKHKIGPQLRVPQPSALGVPGSRLANVVFSAAKAVTNASHTLTRLSVRATRRIVPGTVREHGALFRTRPPQ
jgi:hypothetical protein